MALNHNRSNTVNKDKHVKRAMWMSFCVIVMFTCASIYFFMVNKPVAGGFFSLTPVFAVLKIALSHNKVA